MKIQVELPFEIGDTFYRILRGTKQVPCPVCKGAKKVTVNGFYEHLCL